MDDLNIIDRFTDTFVRYIDSGFGLLAGDVAFLTSVMVGLDIVLAGLFWALDGEDNVPAQLIRKVLYVGFFALLLNNFQSLSDVVFRSFAGLGLKASATTLTAQDLMRPGFVAETGFTASRPLLDKAGELIGFISFFENFVTIVVLMIAWLIVLLAFFVLAVQLFVTILEFKLTTLAGFVLVPFALFGKTAFLAERVLGNVISSGIKLMVLTIIVGIGSTIFGSIVPPAGAAITLVAVVALLSALNANLYGASRMIFSLSERGEAPRFLSRAYPRAFRNASFASRASVSMRFQSPAAIASAGTSQEPPTQITCGKAR